MRIIVQTCLNHQQADHFPIAMDYLPFGNTSSHMTSILLCLQYLDRKTKSIFPNADIVVIDFLRFEMKFGDPRTLTDAKRGLCLEIRHHKSVHVSICCGILKKIVHLQNWAFSTDGYLFNSFLGLIVAAVN